MRAPLALAVALSALAAGASAATPPAPPLTVVARNLDNPRKLLLGPGGALYVVEAGHGGRDRCLGHGAAKTCIGLSGVVARVRGGTATPVVTGLWSGAHPDGTGAEGPAAALARGGRFVVVLQDGSIDARGRNELGRDGRFAGDVVSTPTGTARPTVLANLAAYEAAHNPDHGAGPGPSLGDPPIDSDPYAIAPYRGGLAVADAAGNDVLWIGPSGRLSLLAVLPVQVEPLTPALDRRLGIPTTTRSLAVQAVPTCLAVGPDGALYVGELGGIPFEPGHARIWRIAGGRLSLYARGFTTVADLAFEGRDLLVLEMTTRGFLGGSSPGALVRLAPGGERRVIASAGLLDPTGLAVSGGSIFVSNDGVSPASGAGPHGEVVRLPASSGG